MLTTHLLALRGRCGKAFGDAGLRSGKVLELGAGIGVFAGTRPDAQLATKLTMVEKDQVSAQIAARLYPQQSVRPVDIARVREENTHDAVIGNVPFADVKMLVKRLGATKGAKHSLHNAVILKALYALRPGGLAMLITSRYTLDSSSDTARRQMLEVADLVAAVRLPAESFRKDAGTDVVTDLLVFRKRKPGEQAAPNPDWLNTDPHMFGVDPSEAGPIPRNRLFTSRPEAVLGTERRSIHSGMYQKWGYMVNLVGGIHLADTLPASIRKELRSQMGEAGVESDPIELREDREVESETAVDEDYLTTKDEPIGTLVVRSGQLHRVTGQYDVIIEGKTRTDVIYRPLKAGKGIGRKGDVEKVIALAKMRRLTSKLLNMQRQDAPEVEWKKVQATLKRAWGAFNRKHGAINKQIRTVREHPKTGRESITVKTPNLPKLFKNSPMAGLTMAIEDYDVETGKAKAGTWLTERFAAPPQRPTEVTSAAEGVVLSVTSPETHGTVDPKYVAQLLGVEPEQAEASMRAEQAAFLDPGRGLASCGQVPWSGNVRARLKRVEEAGLADERQALLDHQPETQSIEQISLRGGAMWLPKNVVDGTMRAITGLAFKIELVADKWMVSNPSNYSQYETDRLNPEFQEMLKLGGTYIMKPSDLIRATLNDTPQRITMRSDGKTVFLPQETDMAEEMKRRLGQRFKEVISDAPILRQAAERAWNENVNVTVPFNPKAAPSSFRVEGLAEGIKMRAYQLLATWRGLLQGSMGLFHAVGAGKTLTMLAIAMEQKRLGLVQKPVAVVPLSIFNQFVAEANKFFPGKRILFTDSITSAGTGAQSGGAANINDFIGQVVGSDWDLIVMTHEQFGQLKLSPQLQAAAVREELDELTQIEEQLQEQKELDTGADIQRTKRDLPAQERGS